MIWLKRIFWVLATIVGLLGISLLGVYLAASGDYTVMKTVGQDPSVPHVKIDGVTFHAEAFGPKDAPVVIVLHGGPGNDYRYLLSLKRLSNTYRVVFYDQRGTGLSPRVPRKQLTLQNMLEDVDRIVKHYSKGRPVRLIGHSWGAMLVAGYLGGHFDKVSHAVLAEPGMLTKEAGDAFFEKFKFDIGLRGIARLGWLWMQSRHVKGPDRWAKNDYFFTAIPLLDIPGNPMAGYACGGDVKTLKSPAWRLNFSSSVEIQNSGRDGDGNFHLDLVRGVENYKGKTLFVAGSCNKIIGMPFQKKYHLKYFPNAEIKVIKGAGHTMFGEKPKESLALLRRFLATKSTKHATPSTSPNPSKSTKHATPSTSPKTPKPSAPPKAL